MNRIAQWFTDVIGAALDPEERVSALGDLAESGASAGRVLMEMAGLVARRQVALWKSWRPWVALAGLLPIYLALTSVAPSVAQFLSRYPWTGDSIPKWAIQTVAAITLTVLYSGVTGFVLASLSRRAVYVNGAVFAIVGFITVLRQPIPHADQTAIAMTFVLQALLFFLPFFWGVWYGVRNRKPGWNSTLLLTATVVLMLGCVSSDGKEAMALLLFFNWPFGYLIMSARRPMLQGSPSR
ncbi:MAG: hypothetical protein ACKV22_17455 [Bryobacteraceae bacterium]